MTVSSRNEETTIKGGSRRAEQGLMMMMMKADDDGCQTEVGCTRSMARAEPEQARSRSRVKQSRAERGQELGRNWGGARNVQDKSLKGAGQEYGRGRAEAGAG